LVLLCRRCFCLEGFRRRRIPPTLCLAMKWLLCRVKHVVEHLFGRLWLVLRTFSSKLCLMIVVQHIRYPGINIIILDISSHHLLSRTMRFTMEDPPNRVQCKSIFSNMLYHGLLCFSFPIGIFVARACD
jgi:hypothetical protein